jgi:hypothetical protein
MARTPHICCHGLFQVHGQHGNNSRNDLSRNDRSYSCDDCLLGFGQMPDYYTLIARAVAAIDTNTGEARRSLYDRARTVQLKQLQGLDPPLTESDIDRERLALEEAIHHVEADVVGERLLPPTSPNSQKIARDSLTPPQIKLSPSASCSNLSPRATIEPKRREQKRQRALPSLKQVGAVFLAILGLIAAYIVVPILFHGAVQGIRWLSVNSIEYMIFAVEIAVAVCVLILLPLSFFRSTRAISASGFFISSFVFGATTWVLGFLVTYDYLGLFWVFVGLVVALVGIVPLGIIGAAIKSDWTAAGILCGGLVMTYGARLAAGLVAAKSDSEQ